MDQIIINQRSWKTSLRQVHANDAVRAEKQTNAQVVGVDIKTASDAFNVDIDVISAARMLESRYQCAHS
jgi:hypothetical protein